MKNTILRMYFWLWSRVAPKTAGRWLATRFLTPSERHQPDPQNAKRQDLANGGVLWSVGDGAMHALLIHGWSGFRAQFDAISDLLLQEGYTVHLIDPPGHGAASPGRSNPARFATSIREAVALIGRPDLAIGHSMGGAMLLHLAIGDTPHVAARLFVVSAPHGVRHPLTATAKMLGFGNHAARAFFSAVEQEVGLPQDDFDILPRARNAKIPLCSVHDRNDPQIPFAHASELSRQWPNSELVETQGAGHNRTLQAPKTLAAIKAILSDAQKEHPTVKSL